MKKTTCLALLCLFYYSEISGQEQLGSQIEDVRKSMNQVDLNVSNFFSNGFSGGTLFFKRRIPSKKFVERNAIRLLRIRLEVDESLEVSDPNIGFVINSRLYRNTFNTSSLSIGIERQKSKRGLVEYYGVEGTFRRSLASRNQHWFSSFSTSGDYLQYRDDESTRTNSLAISPFAGLKFFFNNRVNMGIETSFNIISNWRKNDYIFKEIEGNHFTEEEIETNIRHITYSEQTFDFRFTNLRFLTVGYTF